MKEKTPLRYWGLSVVYDDMLPKGEVHIHPQSHLMPPSLEENTMVLMGKFIRSLELKPNTVVFVDPSKIRLKDIMNAIQFAVQDESQPEHERMSLRQSLDRVWMVAHRGPIDPMSFTKLELMQALDILEGRPMRETEEP